MNAIRCGRTIVLCVALVAGAMTRAEAQATANVRGVVYDSLRRMPIPGAAVTMLGDSRTITTDDKGMFAFDGVAVGQHTFVAQHDSLNAVGLSGLSSKALVSATGANIVLAVPSFATFWKITCGDRAVPADSGLIYGTVRTIDDKTPSGVSVDLAWTDLKIGPGLTIIQKRWKNSALTDDRGGYAMCGVPLETNLRLIANADSAASGLIDVPPHELRVERHDILLGPVDNVPAELRGTVAGTLTNERGAPFPDARVTMDGVAEVRSDARGHYVLRDVPAGTRQMEILSIGMLPIVTVLNVYPRDTTNYSTVLTKVTLLQAMAVTASARQRQIALQMEERRKGGFGYRRDSSAINGVGTMASIFFSFPSVQVERGRGSRFILSLPGRMARRCTATLFIDGIYERDFDQLNFMTPDEIALVEVYPRYMTVPMELQSPQGASECGSVAVWTKRALQP